MSTSFGEQAGAYSRGRPDYPAEAVVQLLRPDAGVVADIGAGTGKLTASLIRAGRTLYAVDPDAAMLDVLRGQLPSVQGVIGTAEQIPLSDNAVDALVFGQAWHWVHHQKAVAEASRVLRPGGTVGLIWNIRDESVPWVRRLTDIMGPSEAELYVARGVPELGAGFGPLRRNVVRWIRELSAEQLMAMVSSRSAVITSTDSRRERILAEADRLAAQVADEHGTIALPYVTHTYRADSNPVNA